MQLKKQFEGGGYEAYDSTVDVPVTADDDVAVTVQNISANNGVWSMENMEVLYSVIWHLSSAYYYTSAINALTCMVHAFDTRMACLKWSTRANLTLPHKNSKCHLYRPVQMTCVYP